MPEVVRTKRIYCLPQRLRDARVASGKTIKEVAEILDISAQALSMFELGRCRVTAEMFFHLKNIYGFPTSFYTMTCMDNINRGNIFFRKFSAATKRQRDSSLKRAEFVSGNIMNFFVDKINFPKVDSFFTEIKQSVNVEGERNPEIWAKLVRRKWGLGEEPINNLILALEKRGIIVTVIPMNEEVDGFSYWQDERPYIFCNKQNTAVRLRLSIAHELCHLFFHEHDDVEKDLKQLEKEANQFAGAFLLPKSEFSKDLYSTSMEHFVYLKSKWMVSINAMIVRAYQLELIPDEKYTYLQSQISRKHWRKREPYDDNIEQEHPVLFRQALDLLISKEFITKEDIISQMGLDGKTIEESCSLTSDFFARENLVSTQ